jgi:uracil-DNA glycosylase
MNISLPADWQAALGEEWEKPYFQKLRDFVDAERAEHKIYPPEDQVFSAFNHTPLEQVKVFILGQDPYHGPNQAHGLAFSVQPGIATPPSLVNIFKEMREDVGCKIPNNGYLVPWAERGVMLLNAVLTVRAHQANSHKSKGWEKFTDATIRAVNAKTEHVVFVLWGGYAQKKIPLIDESRHTVVKSVHPSPLSAHTGFLGSKPFSQVNAALQTHGQEPIDWQLPDI